jgi:hypothetical protein
MKGKLWTTLIADQFIPKERMCEFKRNEVARSNPVGYLTGKYGKLCFLSRVDMSASGLSESPGL